MSIEKTIISVTIALAAAALVTGSAQAGEFEASPDTRQIFVSFKGIDLSNEAGGQAMLGRVQKAAAKVCQNRGDPSLRAQAEYRRCRDTAVAGAVERANRPMLTAAYQDSPTRLAQASRAGSGD